MNVVGYVRISRDNDKENIDSLNTQKELINQYAKEHNWIVSKIYEDDNYSGYNFNRPSFKEMMDEATKGNIDIILAKDASRIGRKNSGTLMLFDELRDLEVSLILITEAPDGLDVTKDEDNILGIKTWFNEYYIKDVSRKIRANMHSKQKSGTLIMGNHYGYNKVKLIDTEGAKFKLVVDENIRPAIELIFNSYISGMGYQRVCNILDSKGYPTPSEYLRQKHMNNGRVFKNKSSKKWQTHMILRIIRDDIYVGTLRTKKRHSTRIKGKQEKVDKEDQFVFENHHEAIISKEDFKLAQEINNKRSKKSCRELMAKYDYQFTSFMRCADCGFALSGVNIRRLPVILKGYNCTMYIKYGKKMCTSHAVKEEKVIFFFKQFLKYVREEYKDYITNLKFTQKKNSIKNNLDTLEKELNNTKEEYKLLINDKIKAMLKAKDVIEKETIEKTYEELIEEKSKKITNLTEMLNQLKKVSVSDIEGNIKSNIAIFDKIIESDKPERKDLERILDKILVYEDRHLEFVLKVNIDKLTYSDII